LSCPSKLVELLEIDAQADRTVSISIHDGEEILSGKKIVLSPKLSDEAAALLKRGVDPIRLADRPYLMEVFPSLALVSLEPAFFGLRTGGPWSMRRCARRRIWAARPESVGLTGCGRTRRRRNSTRIGLMQPCVC
jgi:hypothetical protein